MLSCHLHSVIPQSTQDEVGQANKQKQSLRSLTSQGNPLARHLLQLEDLQAVAQAGHGGQRGGLEQQEVLVQRRGASG